jgi:hypothetical protein
LLAEIADSRRSLVEAARSYDPKTELPSEEEKELTGEELTELLASNADWNTN